ncbi:hypothetical protein [Mesorhizobium captivum]|uniref:hypothetical protein n=1 Tax=Mesorhizobium captivum TaxID=3072319 RepID=UPI002A245A51|nr:hypothetical protein [Mesorhizobium sp. VK22E]MDX8510024.1 hypothetical protein [Mesorhizobium sp. VK22E]
MPDKMLRRGLCCGSAEIARYRAAPLLKERLLYLSHCEQIGIKLETLCKIAACQLELVRFLDLHDDDGSNLLVCVR